MVLRQLDIHVEKVILNPCITPNPEVNYRWSTDINACSKIINLSKENMGEHIHDCGVGSDYNVVIMREKKRQIESILN